MLKFIINQSDPLLRADKNGAEGAVIEIELSGTLVDIMTDLTFGLATIYDRLKKSSLEEAEGFRFILTESVTDPDSPLWNTAPPPAEVDAVMLLPNPTRGGQ